MSIHKLHRSLKLDPVVDIPLRLNEMTWRRSVVTELVSEARVRLRPVLGRGIRRIPGPRPPLLDLVDKRAQPVQMFVAGHHRPLVLRLQAPSQDPVLTNLSPCDRAGIIAIPYLPTHSDLRDRGELGGVPM